MQTNLKTLSRQYANGILTKTEYRRARAELIESAQDSDLTEPQATLPYNAEGEDGPSGNKDPEPEPIRPATAVKSSTVAGTKIDRCRFRNRLLLLISGLLLVGLLVLLL
ncbi:SHOCT domain-containing protein [Marinospirillum alkaliphilum]|uniref:SHOCT domain-containing protein n=1 Tax=Marinospirillum alkaliphilum DSM 21637 TaxID=1122209 RepID=A0A1K1Z9C8_9GAMM|nr:SHOCT domain-containing protein [Marinospirillum alkaliphilum]SFX70710.1 hypothetical protein SAMN02745752_02606 [Marinospirillum alkaliphilum DSM 21637]